MIPCKLPFLLLLLSFLTTDPTRAGALPPVEIPVQRVFFADNGYDDHDTIQIRIEGELPDPCYELAGSTVSRDTAGNLLIHPRAWRHSSDECDTDDLLGQAPYSEDVSLGQLPTGDYNVAYAPEEGKTAYRKLHVAESARLGPTGIERMHYARTTDIVARQTVLQGQPVQVVLRGSLSTPCGRIQDLIAVLRFSDTFLIQPIEFASANCVASSPAADPSYEKSLELGVLPPGEYLVQVRLPDGRFLDRTFTVVRTHAIEPPGRLGRNSRF